jgi:hypothetical protein
MGTIEREIEARVPEVWGWLVAAERYPSWLIGAQEVQVPHDWPAPGAQFRHRIGAGLLRIPGSTTSRSCQQPTRFVLTAGMGPLGEAEVTFDVSEFEPGRTMVRMTEVPQKGVLALAHRVAGRLVDRLVDARNAVSLQRLDDQLRANVGT